MSFVDSLGGLKVFLETPLSAKGDFEKHLCRSNKGEPGGLLVAARALLHERQPLAHELTTELQQHLQTVRELVPEEFANELAWKTAGKQPDIELTTQLQHRLTALLSAILAVDALAGWPAPDQPNPPLPEEFLQYAAATVQGFAQSFPFWDGDPVGWPVVDATGAHAASLPRTEAALWQLFSQRATRIADNTAHQHRCAWLATRRLFAWLAEEEKLRPADTARQTRGPMLLAAEAGQWAEVAPLTVVAVPERLAGLYLDPVTLGATVFDHDFLQSMQVAWLLAATEWLGKSPDQAVRVVFELGTDPQYQRLRIGGDSAGGLAAAAVQALAKGLQLTTQRSASVALRLRQKLVAGTASLIAAEVELHTVGGLPEKLDTVCDAGLQALAIHSNQQQEGENHLVRRKVEAPDSHSPQLKAVQRFQELVDWLTRGSLIDGILEKYNKEAVRDEWITTRRPARYVERHFAWLEFEKADWVEGAKPNTRPDRVGPAARPLDLPSRAVPLLSEQARNSVTHETEPGVAEHELAELLGASNRLCLAEDANAGKTVFTWRAREWFAGPGGHTLLGGPALICRWENFAGSTKWPVAADPSALWEVLQQHARDEIAPFCDVPGITPDEVVQYAFEQGRMVWLFDALDQAGNCDLLLHTLTLPKSDPCRVVITGRSFAFRSEERLKHFPSRLYRFATLLGFSENQQNRFFGELAGAGGVRALFPRYAEVRETLSVPGMLVLAARIVTSERERHRKQSLADRAKPFRLQSLRNRCDFYLRFYQEVVLTAAEKDGGPSVEADRDKFFAMQAITAFRMALERAVSGRVGGDLAKRVQQDVARGCQALGYPVLQTDWDALRQFSELSNHEVLDDPRAVGEAEKGVCSWRHKGWMEFFLGVFLANHASPDVVAALRPERIRPNLNRLSANERELGFVGVSPAGAAAVSDPASPSPRETLLFEVLSQLAIDPQWEWGWRMAIQWAAGNDDLHRNPVVPEALRWSFGALFRQPPRGRRPTKLMYEAFPLLEADLDPAPAARQEPRPRTDLHPVLQDFRNEIVGLEQTLPRPQGAMASRLRLTRGVSVLQPPRSGLLRFLSRFVPWIRPHTPQDSAEDPPAEYLPCPPPSWTHQDPSRDPHVFRMGQEGESDNPPQWRSIEPFRLQRGPVTVAQFGLFDAHYRTLHAQHLTQYAPKSDCPAIDVNWWDAWVYCRWLGPGFRLPTEVEWEYACRAGRDRSEDLFGVGNGRELAKRDANFSRSVGQTTPVGQYSPNDWQFVDLHGNVWEWCGDWYNATWLQRLPSSVNQPLAADGGPTVGSSRVVRGGSWFIYGDVNCRSALRNYYAPGSRDVNVGFRVCWRGE